MKHLRTYLRWFGIYHYLFAYQSKKHRRAEIVMPLGNYVAWVSILTSDFAKANEITPLALISEIKKAMQELERKEDQDESS